MKSAKRIIFPLSLLAAFCLGFTANQFLSPASETPVWGHVTGIGGVFFKADDPQTLKKWYHDNLGMNIDQYGTNFQWYQGADSTKKGYTQWSVFGRKTTYFGPSQKDFMINYRVTNFNALVEHLRAANVTFTDTVETYDYGKFVHIMDPEGNKIELWEPVDEMYGKSVEGLTK